MEFLALCRKIIEIESTPSTGNEEVALFCADICRKEGFNVTIQETRHDFKTHMNVLARPPSSDGSREEIIFQSHLDTVEPGPLGNWSKTDNNPFKATIEKDRIYGLGTADVKLDFLCKLRALKEFLKQPMKKPFVLVGTFAEEIGMHGARFLMESKAVRAKQAIVGEPSELQIVYANNGYMILDFEFPFSDEELEYKRRHDPATVTTQEKIFHGKAAHSSTPQLGDNAIHKMFTYLKKMPKGICLLDVAGGSSVNTVPADAHVEVDGQHCFNRSVGDRLLALVEHLFKLEGQFMNFDAPEFSPSHPTMNIGLLKTTETSIHMSVSFRLTPNVPMESVETWIAGVQEAARGQDARCRRSRLSPPALTSLESDLVKGALEISKSLNLPEKPITKASGTECSVYRPFGLDCIVFGPGVSIGNSHTANEYNLLPHLEGASRFYGEAVKRFCL